MLMCFSHENNFYFLTLNISHRFLIMARLVTKYLTQFRQLGKNRSLELLESGHFNGTGKITMKKYILGCDTGIASDNPTRMLYYLSYQGYHKWRRKYKYLIWRKLGNLTPFGVAFVLVNALSKDSKEVMLTRAAKYGNLKELKKLLSEGVDVNARHPLGWTALHVAVINGQSHIVQALLDAGADPDIGDEFTNPQKIALEKNMAYVDVCTLRYQEFSDKINYNATFEGFTALHYAVLMNNQDIVKSLLLAGANPTKKNSANFPPGDYCNKGPIKDLLISHIPKYGELLKKREAEERKRFPLEQRLKKFIVGQQGAIAVVSSAIRRKENGWTDDEHPLVFLFLGSSGVGKTELAKQVARYLHKDNPNAFIRLDMSEYQEKHEVAKLIGSPPGYIGHEDGGQLTKRLKKFPNAVVLFDEVDKAHPDVLTTLLQLFDEGRLTDGKGETIVCRDAIFVMTSNVASEEIAQHALELRREAEKLNSYRTGAQQKNKDDITETEQVTISRKFKDQVVRPVLKRHFKRDEFLGRINEFVYFLPFSKSELARLVTMELEFWAQKALKKHNIILTWNKDVTEALIGGYDVHYGARSIKYEIERRIISQLALGHEKGVVTPGSSIQIEAIWPKEDKNHEKSPVINLKVRQRGQRKFVNLDPYENIFKDTGFL